MDLKRLTEDDIQYGYQKEQFNDRLTDFFRKQGKLSIKEVIEKLKSFISEYEKYYNDDDTDVDLIKHIKSNLEGYIEAEKSKSILKKKVEVKEQIKIKKDATTIEFKYNTSLWRKLFNLRSYNNELYGQSLLHVTIGVICDIKIPVKRSQHIWARPSIFYIQRSRSGKNEGMYYVEDVLKEFQKKILQDGKTHSCRPIRTLRIGKKTDPTLLNRFAMINKKGITEVKRDANGEPVVIQGELEKSDLVWYPEANYLLNPTGHNEEEINIHLNLLEPDGEYTKELASWGGLSSTTKGGHYALVAITRPVQDIKKYIVYNGLLQRTIFEPRFLKRQERKKMLEFVAIHSHTTKKQKEEYVVDFKQLIKELEEIQNFALQNPPEVRDEDSEIFISELHKKLMYFDSNVQKECSIEANKEIFEDFIANYTNFILMISYQSAVIRKSKWVELVDLEYAFNFLNKTFEMMKPWIEESIEESKAEHAKTNMRRNCMHKMKSQYKPKIKISEAIKYITKDQRVSYPTAKTILENFAEIGPFKMIDIDYKAKIVTFL